MRARIVRFRTAVALFREMGEEGVITPAELRVILTDLAEKTGLSSSTIFSDNDLIIPPSDGNM